MPKSKSGRSCRTAAQKSKDRKEKREATKKLGRKMSKQYRHRRLRLGLKP